MKKKLIAGLFLAMSTSASAEIVNTQLGLINEITSWAEAEYIPSVDGDTLIKLTTGIAECPSGVYIQNSEYADRLLSMAMAAYVSSQTVRFQIWNDAEKFWKGSKDNFCKVRSVRLTKV
ncbi:hypothetical protein IFO68_11780 [Photobacterium sp. CAU 1568]|uniref:Uncharacterized protein n=1 Tax=Photobacterium arenosum TaxID=2774143 RepID=A0ABR9BLC4_9GAMM|nr:hypothetical protein [Photobacterium arenosum]MBD8513355.1 hypothetical protein [Photobacterium arenosum]